MGTRVYIYMHARIHVSVCVKIRSWCQVSSSNTVILRLGLSWLGWLAISSRKLPGSTKPYHWGYRCVPSYLASTWVKVHEVRSPGCPSRWILSSTSYWIWWPIFLSIIPLQFIPLCFLFPLGPRSQPNLVLKGGETETQTDTGLFY